MKLIHIWHRITDKYCWIRNFLFHRYDLIRTGLNKGAWHDTDRMMLYGMMNLLVEYVEIEDIGILEREYSTKGTFTCDDQRLYFERSHEARKEIKAIYNWWKDYPNRQKQIQDAYDKWEDYLFEKREIEGVCSDIEIEHMEDKLSQEEQDMLIRLVKIREFLWT